MHVTIDPRPVQPVNHCFTTCTGRTSRTSRVKPFTGRIRSTVLDKDAKSRQLINSIMACDEASEESEFLSALNASLAHFVHKTLKDEQVECIS